jgi:hypothetical protein
MKLTIAVSNTIYQIDGTAPEISKILTELIGTSEAKVVLPVSNDRVKLTKFNKPAASKLSKENAAIISSLFAYPMSKNTDIGRPAYVAAILLDGEPHSIADIKLASNSLTTKPIHTAIDRLRKSGSAVTLSTKYLTPNTIVQVTKVNTNVQATKFKKASTSRNSFKNLSV